MNKSILNLEPFGEFEYRNSEKIWICFSKNIDATNVLEISFEVEDQHQNLDKKIELMRNFVNQISETKDFIYDFVQKRHPDKTIDKLKSTWFLSVIGLENDDQTWKIVFEPEIEVETIYNYFLRFTIVNKEIVWSNLSEV